MKNPTKCQVYSSSFAGKFHIGVDSDVKKLEASELQSPATRGETLEEHRVELFCKSTVTSTGRHT